MHYRAHRVIVLALAALTLITLACNAGGAPSNPEATVRAVYATITVQAASTSSSASPTSPQSAITQTPITMSTVTPTPPDSRGSVILIQKCSSAITVDGSDTDWTSQPKPSVLTMATTTFGAKEWTGPSDLSGIAYLCWTDSSLFMFVKVTDDVHAQTQRGENSYLGDEVELMFDSDLRGDFYNTTWDKDDVQLSFNPGNFADLVPQPFRYRPTAGQPRGIEMVAKPTGSSANYVVEAEIIWEELLAHPVIGQNYGLCLALNDNDHTDKAQEDTLVSHCAGLSVPNPTTWQTVTFGQ